MQTKLNRNRKRQAGFSLIEILIVIALIAILVSVTVGNLGNVFGDRKSDLAKIFVSQTAKIGFQAYMLDVGSYPSTEEGISALIKPPAGKASRWRGPYLEEIPQDPWQRDYQYRFPGTKNINGARGYDLFSLGPDGEVSGDDIGNWKTAE